MTSLPFPVFKMFPQLWTFQTAWDSSRLFSTIQQRLESPSSHQETVLVSIDSASFSLTFAYRWTFLQVYLNPPTVKVSNEHLNGFTGSCQGTMDVKRMQIRSACPPLVPAALSWRTYLLLKTWCSWRRYNHLLYRLTMLLLRRCICWIWI